MKKLLGFIIIALFLGSSYCHAGGDKLKIIFINTPEVVVDGVGLHVGDTFFSDATIRWDNPRQVVKVINMSSKKQQIMKPEPIEVATSHSTKDYLNLDYNLSTRNEVVPAAYFFLEYQGEKGGKMTRVISEEASLAGLPEKVSLLYCDASGCQDVLITDDFNGFIDEFRWSDRIISYVIDYRKHWKVYQWLMYKLMDRPHCDVEYTQEDVKLYLSLK